MQNRKQNRTTVEFVLSSIYYGWFRFLSWFRKNLRDISLFVLIVLPILVMCLGDGAVSDGQSLYFAPVNAIFLLIEILAVCGLAVSDNISRPQDVPLPARRFTRHDDEEVWVDNGRIQELVLYMDCLEDWFYDNYYTYE